MSLARGEKSFEAGAEVPDFAAALLIAIAPSAEERMRVARLVDRHVAVLLVASVDDALALLGRDCVDGVTRPGAGPREMSATGLIIDSDRRTASYEGASVSLSPLEHDLLRCLLDDAGHTWQFEDLHRLIWGTGHLGGLADVQSVVKRLRRKLRDLRCPVRIASVRGVGLRLDGPLASTG